MEVVGRLRMDEACFQMPPTALQATGQGTVMRTTGHARRVIPKQGKVPSLRDRTVDRAPLRLVQLMSPARVGPRTAGITP